MHVSLSKAHVMQVTWRGSRAWLQHRACMYPTRPLHLGLFPAHISLSALFHTTLTHTRAAAHQFFLFRVMFARALGCRLRSAALSHGTCAWVYVWCPCVSADAGFVVFASTMSSAPFTHSRCISIIRRQCTHQLTRMLIFLHLVIN